MRSSSKSGSRKPNVSFVRLVRTKEMKFGVALDVAGKRWRGFFAQKTAEEIYHSATLGPVGLCFVCGDRVYEGWECVNFRQDACRHCVQMPPQDRIIVLESPSDEEWMAILKENALL